MLHAAPPCAATFGCSCRVDDVGDVAAPFFVHSVKSWGRVDAVLVALLERVVLGVPETELVEVGDGEADSVFVEDAEAPGVSGAEGVLVAVGEPVGEEVMLGVPLPVAVDVAV